MTAFSQGEGIMLPESYRAPLRGGQGGVPGMVSQGVMM